MSRVPSRRQRHVAAIVVALLATVSACSSAPDASAPNAREVFGTQPPATQPPATAPGTTPGTTPSIGEEVALEATVAELSAFVEEAQGLTFNEPVQVHLADDAEFEELLLATITEDDWADMEASMVTFEALGLVEPGTDVRVVVTDLLGAGVLGYYDPITDELVVRGADMTPFVRETLVHELVHALDDQHFDLDRPELYEATDESDFGFSAVVEGNARYVEQQYHDQLTPEERRSRDDEELDLALEQGPRLRDVPEILVDQISAPYSYGQDLIEVIVADGGMPAVDAAIDDVPTTSEQVMDPAAYEAREAALAVTPPTADGEILDEGTFGQLMTLLLLGDSLGGSSARAAAEGWGGDAYVSWRGDDDVACTRIVWRMDTPTDLDDLRDALALWAVDNTEARLDSPDAGTVQLESCAAAPGTEADVAAAGGTGTVLSGVRTR